MTFIRLFITGVFLIFAGPAFAAAFQDDAASFYPEGVNFDPGVPDPEAYLGHKLGQKAVRHHRMVDYLEMLGDLSGRVRVETYGVSHEGRPILLVTITSPENMARIDDIRAAHVALSDPALGQEITDDMPVVTWLTYGVHGAEASAMDSVLPVAYYFAAAEGKEIEKILTGSIILLLAIHNPDGHARRIAWLEQNSGETVIRDANDRVQNHEWPGGRTNHYWFDLNRQWLLQTQPASQALLKAWHAWKPNISIDYHEMGTSQTYYFHPGIPDQTYPLMPEATLDLMRDWAAGPAKALDAEQRFYYTEETFNYFYIGTGSSYPMVNGAVGMLFEASSARAFERDGDNGLRTYRDNIWKHFRTSIASVISAHRLRSEFLTHQKDFYIEAGKLAARDNAKGYVVTEQGDQVRLWEFLNLLERHQVRFHVLARDLRVNGKLYPAGESYVIPTDQPQYLMVKSLFEIETGFATTVFYDVSAWNMPLWFGLDYSELGSLRANQLGSAGLPEPPAVAAPDVAPFAYVFDWRPYYAPRALNRLHQAGLLTRVATKPMTVKTTRGDVAVARGAIIVPLFGQPLTPEEIHALMVTIAAEDAVEVLAATSAMTPEVGADLGGESVKPLNPVKALLVTGAGVSSYDAGEIWHLLDYRMKMPLTRVNLANLKGVNLWDYTHLILPQGYDPITFDDGYLFEEDLAADIERWIRDGGVLVATRNGAEWAEKTYLKEDQEDREEAEEAGEEPKPRSDYANRRKEEAEDVIGGAIFGSDLDITHPLGFGYNRRSIASNKANTFILETPQDRYAAVAVYNQTPRLTGYSSDDNMDKIKGTPMLVAVRMGKGAIILFADNPNFRAITWGTNKLFLNALFFSGIF